MGKYDTTSQADVICFVYWIATTFLDEGYTVCVGALFDCRWEWKVIIRIDTEQPRLRQDHDVIMSDEEKSIIKYFRAPLIHVINKRN